MTSCFLCQRCFCCCHHHLFTHKMLYPYSWHSNNTVSLQGALFTAKEVQQWEYVQVINQVLSQTPPLRSRSPQERCNGLLHTATPRNSEEKGFCLTGQGIHFESRSCSLTEQMSTGTDRWRQNWLWWQFFASDSSKLDHCTVETLTHSKECSPKDTTMFPSEDEFASRPLWPSYTTKPKD